MQRTPPPHSRKEAWQAWEAANLAKYIDPPTRPSSQFWKRWRRTCLDLFETTEIRHNSGFVSAIHLHSGEPVRINLITDYKLSTLSRNSFVYSFQIKPALTALADAQEFICRSYLSRDIITGGLTGMQVIAECPYLKQAERRVLSSHERLRGCEIVTDTTVPVWTRHGLTSVEFQPDKQQRVLYLDGVYGEDYPGLYLGLVLDPNQTDIE